MKAFITGASGFIGNHLTQEFIRRNWHVRVLLHKTPISVDKNYEIVRGDILDFELLKKSLKGTDILFHLAAALGASLINKQTFYKINAQGTENVLKAARETGVNKIIHFSSAGVLGSTKRNDIADEGYPLNPIDVYDKSKLEGEKIALRYANEGMNVIIIRPGWVYGPGDRRTFKLIKSIAKKRFILVTRGKTFQTPICIDDLIQGSILCSERGKKGEIYHLAGKEILTVREIVHHIAEATGEKIPGFTLPLFPLKVTAFFMEKLFSLFKKEAPLTMGKLAFFCHPKPLSIKKAKKELGFSPEIDFQTGIIRAVSWYKGHGWL